MKVFDRLCRAIRTTAIPKEYEQLATDCKIFNFKSVLTEEPTLELLEADSLVDRLGLPFPETALVLDDICVIMKDTIPTTFIFMYAAKEAKHNFILTGIARLDFIDNNRANIKITSDKFYTERNGIVTLRDLDSQRNKEIEQTLTQLLTTLYTKLVEINTIDKFILEISPRKKFKNRAISQQDERPEYIILHPKCIRERMQTEKETGKGKGVHERRGHTRTYPDNKERFPKAHGKTIWIEPCWAGTTEAVIGKKQYKVILT